eukprot:m.19238 g.19238  ORF g.19238 m.19238 type:complete len:433 (-) comp6517_c0_seq1:144-1442(-)
MDFMLVLSTYTLLLSTKPDVSGVIHPSWDYNITTHGHVCTDASTTHAAMSENNTRWTFWALPQGAPPKDGWPVYVDLMAEILSPGDWRTPISQLPKCGNGWVPPSDGWIRPQYNVFDSPIATMKSCFTSDGSWLPLHGPNCTYFQKAGQLWVSRLHQYLLANGIAILVVNPYAGDTWEWDVPNRTVGSGLDQPFFHKLFGSISNGTYDKKVRGMFNLQKTIFSGFSDGAQMTSWLIQLQAINALPKCVRIAAGVFISGGSHRCYLSPGEGAVGNCNQKCTNAGSCSGGSGNRGCSLTANPLCCDYCCPQGYTEDYYAENPDQYTSHPPCFLAQSAASDFNADLCAAKLYYDALQKHNVTSKLVLLAKEDARCNCVGQRNDTSSSEGRYSPLAFECALIPPEPPGPRGNCVDHVYGFAAMILPLTEFLLDVVY